MARGLKLEDLEVYKTAMEIGDIVWSIVTKLYGPLLLNGAILKKVHLDLNTPGPRILLH
jgi:hypothetical protein